MKTVTLFRLYDLESDLNFEVAQASPDDIAENALLGFKKRLGDILQEDLKEQVKLRSEAEQLREESRKPNTGDKN